MNEPQPSPRPSATPINCTQSLTDKDVSVMMREALDHAKIHHALDYVSDIIFFDYLMHKPEFVAAFATPDHAEAFHKITTILINQEQDDRSKEKQEDDLLFYDEPDPFAAVLEESRAATSPPAGSNRHWDDWCTKTVNDEMKILVLSEQAKGNTLTLKGVLKHLLKDLKFDKMISDAIPKSLKIDSIKEVSPPDHQSTKKSVKQIAHTKSRLRKGDEPPPEELGGGVIR